MAPNIGAGGSHPQSHDVTRRKKAAAQERTVGTLRPAREWWSGQIDVDEEPEEEAERGR